MSRSPLDALLGRLFDTGEELELLGGLNFIGFTITQDDANNRYNIIADGGALTSDDIANESDFAVATVTDALNAALGLIDGLGSTYASVARSLVAGAGLTGGGDLSADRTFNVVADADGTITVTADAVKVGTLIAANYGANTIALTKLVNASATKTFVMRTTAGSGAWEEGTAANALAALSGGTIAALTATALTCTTINGVTIAAPVEGTALTDADQTLNVSGGNNYVQSTALTASRTKTLGTSGSPETGEIVTITRTTTAAFTMPVVNGGAGGGTLYTFPSAGKRVADFRYDGTNWSLAGVKRIQ